MNGEMNLVYVHYNGTLLFIYTSNHEIPACILIFWHIHVSHHGMHALNHTIFCHYLLTMHHYCKFT